MVEFMDTSFQQVNNTKLSKFKINKNAWDLRGILLGRHVIREGVTKNRHCCKERSNLYIGYSRAMIFKRDVHQQISAPGST